ncbi:hypothetical protein BDC45DRAFT_535466 [Circinella umbellata]|nr:hypothetical protein BDC45DRAFT_535466 [Circinella umbellata]
MGAQAVDYRVSKVIVCCKDCGQDVGLYPARHKCQDVVRPPLPPLPTKFDDNLRVPRKPIPSHDSNNNNEPNRSRPTSAASSNSSGTTNHNVTSDTSSATSTGSKWSRFVRSPSNNNIKANPNNNNNEGENDDDSFYYNNFAAHLPDQTSDSGSSPGQAGKKLWGKVRQNEKWKQLNEKYDKPKQTAKLWGKLVQATQTISDKMPSRDDRGPESDESDWEGETHVSRVIREYYEKKHEPLPRWLFDERAPQPKTNRYSNQRQSREQDDSMLPPLDRQVNSSRPSKKKLWEADPEPQMSQREREREELRQRKQRPPPPSSSLKDTTNNVYEHPSSEERSYRQHQTRSGTTHLDPYEDRPYSSRRAPVIEPTSHHHVDRSYTTNNTTHSSSRRTAPSMDHDMYEDRHSTSRSAAYRRPVENEGTGWKMSSRNKPPSRYGDDDGSSRNYLSDRHVPAAARARSPSRYNDDISPSTSSDNYKYSARDRVRGPRDIPQQFSNRYSERGGGYF